MKFPAILSDATLKNDKVYFDSSVISDDGLVEYLEWKAWLGVTILTPSRLRQLHRKGQFYREIFALFKKNKKVEFLSQDRKLRGKKS